MNLEIRNLKTNEGLSDETLCFSAALYVDGKKAAIVCNRGTGGPHEYDTHLPGCDPALLQAAEDWAKAQKIVVDCSDFGEESFELTSEKLDWLVSQLIEREEERKWFKRQCSKKTLFRLEGDEEGTWRTIKSPWNETVETFLREKYGDKVVEIANKTRL